MGERHASGSRLLLVLAECACPRAREVFVMSFAFCQDLPAVQESPVHAKARLVLCANAGNATLL